MGIEVKTYYPDEFSIANNIKDSVYNTTKYISMLFNKLDSMNDVDRLLQELLEVTIFDPLDYIMEFRIIGSPDESVYSSIISKLDGSEMSYIDGSFEKSSIARYNLSYKDTSFIVLTDNKRGVILSVDYKLLQEISSYLMK